MHRVAGPQQTRAESVLRFMGLALYNVEEQIGTYARISYASSPLILDVIYMDFKDK